MLEVLSRRWTSRLLLIVAAMTTGAMVVVSRLFPDFYVWCGRPGDNPALQLIFHLLIIIAPFVLGGLGVAFSYYFHRRGYYRRASIISLIVTVPEYVLTGIGFFYLFNHFP